jgi:hypothetical protein
MRTHYHAVVWIDHRQARVFRFNGSDADKLVVDPDNPVRTLHHKVNSSAAVVLRKIGISSMLRKSCDKSYGNDDTGRVSLSRTTKILGLLRVCLAHPKGLEPLASAFGGQRSIQLSYGCCWPQ